MHTDLGRFWDYVPEFKERELPPLSLGDEFEVNANLEQDAIDLSLIYGIEDVRALELYLSVVRRESVLECDMLASLLSRRPDIIHRFRARHFLRDCQRAVVAEEALWRD